MSLIKIPRGFPRRVGSIRNMEEVNRWATDVDLAFEDIMETFRRLRTTLGPLTNGVDPTLTYAEVVGAIFGAAVPAYRSGTGAPGSEVSASRAGHVHPTDYIIAALSVSQVINLAVGDHVGWDSSDVLSGVTLDTTTVYTNGAGASIGRFTLSGGKTYRLRAGLKPTFSGATGRVEYRWSNDSGNLTGRTGVVLTQTLAGHEGDQPEATAIVAPVADTLYEVRFTVATALSAIISTYSYALVETI